MRAAEIDPAIQADPDLLHLVHRAMSILNSEVGRVEWRDQVSASWTLLDRGLNMSRLQLRLEDDIGDVQAEFPSLALQKPDSTAQVMRRLWGDLLQVRSHKLLKKLSTAEEPSHHLDGDEALDQILDSLAEYSEREGHEPKSIRLPVRYATALMKLGPSYWGEFHRQIRESGLRAFDGQTLLGMKVELILGVDAELQVA